MRLVYVDSISPAPTGAILSLDRRLALLAWASRSQAYVLEDDFDAEFRYTGRPLESMQGLDRAGRVIYIGTFSRIFFPSMRLGYMVLPESLVRAFSEAKWLTDRHTPALEQEVLADFIRKGIWSVTAALAFEKCVAPRRSAFGSAKIFRGFD